MSRLFFIDFDNTILSHRTMTIPESAIQALVLLKKKGHKVILASGRSFRGNLSAMFNNQFTPDCLVSSNGAIVEAEGVVLWEKYFDPDIQTRLFDYIRQKQYCLMVNYNDIWYTSNLDRYLSNPNIPTGLPLPPGEDAFLTLYDKPLTSLFLQDTLGAIIDIQQHFPELKLLYMGEELGGADIIPRENGKTQGMERIINYYRASRSDTIAIGDSMNDLEMIQYADLGIAMGNAMPEIKAAADYVAKDIDDDGLWDAIQYALQYHSA